MFRRRLYRSLSVECGFTMLELMTSVAVAGVLAAIGVPAMTSWVQNQRLVTAANSMVLSLNYARNEALKRDLPNGVEVCASSDHLTCNSTNWALGWIVADVTSGTLLNSTPALSSNMTMTETNAQSVLTYLPNGAIPSAAPAAFQFRICDSRGAPLGRELEVNAMGRIASASSPGTTVNGGALGGC